MEKQVDFAAMVATLRISVISQRSGEFIDVKRCSFPWQRFSAIDEDWFRVEEVSGHSAKSHRLSALRRGRSSPLQAWQQEGEKVRSSG